MLKYTGENMLNLSELVVKAYSNTSPSGRQRREFVSAIIYGPLGVGKTSYAAHVLREVYGGWFEAQQFTVFTPLEYIDLVTPFVESGERVKCIVFDDAGYWLSKLSAMEKTTKTFTQFYNLIRETAAAILFTTPTDDIPSNILKKVNLRVIVERHRDGVHSIAKIYRNTLNPLLKQYIQPIAVDIYPTELPDHYYRKYMERKLNVTRQALKMLRETFKAKQREEEAPSELWGNIL